MDTLISLTRPGPIAKSRFSAGRRIAYSEVPDFVHGSPA